MEHSFLFTTEHSIYSVPIFIVFDSYIFIRIYSQISHSSQNVSLGGGIYYLYIYILQKEYPMPKNIFSNNYRRFYFFSIINYSIYSAKNQVFNKNLITFMIVYKNNLFIGIIRPLLLIFIILYFFENYLEIPN